MTTHQAGIEAEPRQLTTWDNNALGAAQRQVTAVNAAAKDLLVGLEHAALLEATDEDRTNYVCNSMIVLNGLEEAARKLRDGLGLSKPS